MGINSEKTSQIFFFFFLHSVGVLEDHTSLHYPFVHAGAPADYLYAAQSHSAFGRAHTHTLVMDFLETRSPKKDEEEEKEEEVYREKRLFRYFFFLVFGQRKYDRRVPIHETTTCGADQYL